MEKADVTEALRQSDGSESHGPERAVRLKRSLGLCDGVAIVCGLIIGTGIYISPKGVVNGAGSVGLSLILWLAAGAVAFCGAMSMAEMGVTLTASGEKHHYLRHIYGELVGFLYLWEYLLVLRPGANAIKCLTFSHYLLRTVFADCAPPASAVQLLAILYCLTLICLNCVRASWAQLSQRLVATLSALSLATIAGLGLWWLSAGHTEHLQDPFQQSSTDVGDIILGWYSGLYAFGGWNVLNFLTEEVRDPARTLPRAIGISMALVTVLYLLVNLAYFTVLGVEGVMTSPAVAVSFGARLLGPGAWVIIVFIIISNTGSFTSGVLAASRLAFVGARCGHFPALLGLISLRGSTPITSTLFYGLLIVLFTFAGDIYWILKNIMLVNAIFDGLCVVGLLWLRYKQPELPRPLRVWTGFPVVFALNTVVMVVVPIVTKPTQSAIGLAFVLATGIPYYIIVVRNRKLPKPCQRLNRYLTIFVQKLLFCVPESKEGTK